MKNFMLRRLAILALPALLAGCFDDSAYTPFIHGLGDASFHSNPDGRFPVDIGTTSLKLTGSFFPPSSVVYWNGKPQATTFKGPGELDFALDPGLTDDDASAQVAVGTAGVPLSNTVTAVVEQDSVGVTSSSPTSARPGDGPIALTVNGLGFVDGAQVLWDGVSLPTTRVNGHQLTAIVPASLLVNAGIPSVELEVPCCTRDNRSFAQGLPFQVGQSTIVTVTDGSSLANRVNTFDLAGDASRGRIYGAQPFFNGMNLLTIDPVAASVTSRTVIASSNDVRLAISDQDQFLYVIHEGLSSAPATRYTLPGFTDPTDVGAVASSEVAPAPGLPATAALVLATGDIAIVDGTALRPNRISAASVTSVVWGFDSTTLYVVSAGQVQRYAVDAFGIDGLHPTLVATGVRGSLFYDRTLRRLYGTDGSNLDEQGNSHGRFVLPVDFLGRSDCATGVSDAANGKVFFACGDDQVGFSIRSYDADTSAALGTVPLATFGLPPSKIVRWGTDGLAVAVSSEIVDYRGSLVR